MVAQQTTSVRRLSGGGPSGDVVGGLILTVLGVLHVFGLGLGGALGFALLLVVWPLIAGAIAGRIERRRPNSRDWGTTSAVAGTFGAFATALIVILTGVAGMWSGFLTTTFGTDFAAVVFAVWVLLTLCWTVFSYAGGFVESRIAA